MWQEWQISVSLQKHKGQHHAFITFSPTPDLNFNGWLKILSLTHPSVPQTSLPKWNLLRQECSGWVVSDSVPLREKMIYSLPHPTPSNALPFHWRRRSTHVHTAAFLSHMKLFSAFFFLVLLPEVQFLKPQAKLSSQLMSSVLCYRGCLIESFNIFTINSAFQVPFRCSPRCICVTPPSTVPTQLSKRITDWTTQAKTIVHFSLVG